MNQLNLNIPELFSRFINISLFLLIVIYLIFALIVLRQVFLMSDVIITGVNKFVKLFALLHLLFSFALAFFVLTTLVF